MSALSREEERPRDREGAYMLVDGGEQRLRSRREADTDTGREDLREAVESEHASDLGLLELEREI